jgi:hypothetical protein
MADDQAGELTKKCRTCGEVKPLSAYHPDINASLGVRNMCRACRCQYQMERYHNFRVFIREYLLSHPCIDCGESDPVVLEFDHVHGDKLCNVSHMFSSSKARLAAEIAKCVIRCANCHRRKTAAQFNYYASLKDCEVV